MTGVGRDSIQGDVAFADVLARLGAAVRFGPDWIEAAKGDRLAGGTLDCTAIPDAAMTLAVTALFGFLSGWGEFVLASLLLYDESLYTAALGIIGLQDGYRTPWGWFAAASLIFSIPVVILFLFLQRNLVSGLSQGAVK